MSSIYKSGINKNFWCKIGLHKYGRWIRHIFMNSNVIDLERRCKKCGQIKIKTIPRDFEYGYE